MNNCDNNKTIWMISHYASFLESRPVQLGRAFVKEGYKVVVITSSFHHGFRKYLFDEEYHVEEKGEGITFVYLHSGPAYQKNDSKRVLNFFSFNRLTRKYAGKIAGEYGNPTFIIGSSLHPLVWETSNSLAKRYGAKWVAEVRDLWPLQLTEMMGLGKLNPIVLFFGMIEKRAYKRSNAIVTTMPYAYKYISGELGFDREKISWMPNGIDTQLADQNLADESIVVPAELDEYLTNHWCAVFSGSIVKGERLSFIVDAFNKIKNQDIHLAIIGTGHYKDEIVEKINNMGLDDRIRIFDRVDYNVIPKILDKAGCCVAAHDDSPLYKYGISMMKNNDYLYSGKPVVFACSAENVVSETLNKKISSDDIEGFAEAIDYYHDASKEELDKIYNIERTKIREVYDYALIGKRYIELMEKM